MRPDEDREPERDVQPVLDGRAADVDGLFGGVPRTDFATPSSADEFIDVVLL